MQLIIPSRNLQCSDFVETVDATDHFGGSIAAVESLKKVSTILYSPLISVREG